MFYVSTLQPTIVNEPEFRNAVHTVICNIPRLGRVQVQINRGLALD
jgi:hypothetical protein